MKCTLYMSLFLVLTMVTIKCRAQVNAFGIKSQGGNTDISGLSSVNKGSVLTNKVNSPGAGAGQETPQFPQTNNAPNENLYGNGNMWPSENFIPNENMMHYGNFYPNGNMGPSGKFNPNGAPFENFRQPENFRPIQNYGSNGIPYTVVRPVCYCY